MILPRHKVLLFYFNNFEFSDYFLSLDWVGHGCERPAKLSFEAKCQLVPNQRQPEQVKN